MGIALACRTVGTRLTTFEVMREKVDLASETIVSAGLTDMVRLIHGDFRDYADRFDKIAFCLNDERVDAMVATIGRGQLVCRRV